MKLSELKLTFLDLQTTGATPENGNILELAWCNASAAMPELPEIHSRLITQPDETPVPARIKALTGISDDDMQASVPLDQGQAGLFAAMSASDRDGVLIIHFAQFEQRFLNAAFAEQFPSWRIYCTHQIATRLFPNLPSRGIRGLSGYFGLPMQECKRAETHVMATFLIWRNLCAKLSEAGVHTLGDLDRWLDETKPAKRTKYEYPLDKAIRLAMPDRPGIYRMLSRTGDVLYVGKATSLKSRVNSYFRGQRGRDSRKLEMLTQTWDIRHTVCETVVEACLLEVQEIKRLAPPYNVSLKVEDRPLIFYADDFTSGTTIPSHSHPWGPFRSEFILDPFVRFLNSVRTGEFDPLMFFDELSQELLVGGFGIFLQRHELEPDEICNPRSLLALGLILRRRYAALEEEEEDDAERTEDVLNDNRRGGIHAALEPEVVEVTPEDVADKYERLLMRSASSYRLAKRLTQLLNSQIEFEENGKMHRLLVREGELDFSPGEVPLPNSEETCRSALAWKDLTLEVFDRMRVLNTELSRIRSEGGVAHLPTW